LQCYFIIVLLSIFQLIILKLKMNKPWLNHYPPNVPANINPDEYNNIIELLDQTVKKYSNLIAFTCMGKDLSYKKLDEDSTSFGAYLLSRGLKSGDKIALMMPNMLQYPIVLFGCLKAGLVVVNTNPLYTPREMKYQFVDADVKAIIIAENFGANLEKIIAETKIETVIITSIGEMLGTIKGNIVNFVVRKIKKLVPKYNLKNTVTYTHAVKEGKYFSLPTLLSSSNDVIILQYTGGTTGISKGAMLTNRNLIANMLQIRSVMLPFLETGEEIALCPLPLYHIYAFTVNCLALFSIGTRNILITNARDIGSIIKELQKYPVTLITGVNTLYKAILNHPNISKVNFSSLKICSGGGMAVQSSVAKQWHTITGCYLAEGYGLTETSPVASTNTFDGTGRIGFIGMPIPSTDMRIVDELYRSVPIGDIGELQIRGPQVMKGYYKKPEETDKSIVDGWFCTGDLGLMTEDGYFKIVDRKKDMILVSGFNVYPNEIEDVLSTHPKVLEVACIGIPDEKSGEVVKVVIVKKDNSLTQEEVITFCKINMTGYKVPKHVEFRTELPKTNVGKILRRELK
jgi:long-chain acyl-CoA synthetase